MSAEKSLLISADFGIENYLAKDSRILYDIVFSTKHIGRVIDFFMYESSSFFSNTDESSDVEQRFRQIMELAIFNGWRNYRTDEKPKCIEMEVGWDTDKLILSVTASFNSQLNPIDLSKNYEINEQTDITFRIRKMLSYIKDIADELVIRHCKDSGRIQIISSLSKTKSSEKKYDYVDVTVETLLPSKGKKISRLEHLANANVDQFNKDSINQDAKAFPQLLVNNTAEKPVDLSQEDWLKHVQGQSEAQENNTIRIKGVTDTQKDEIVKISSSSESNESEVVVKSDTGLLSLDEALNIGGSESTSTSDSKTIISGTGTTEKGILGTGLEFELEKIAKESVSDLRHELGSIEEKIVQDAFSPLFEKSIRGIYEKYLNEVNHILKMKGLDKEEEIVFSGVTPDKLEQDLDNVMISYSKKLENVNSSEDAKKIVSEMFAELQKEKGEFNKKVRQIDADQRKRELEMRTFETMMKEQVRKKDETIRQRELSLEKAKESLTNALGTISRLKSEMGNSNHADTVKKLMIAEKTLAVTKENNDKNVKRIEEIQVKWMKDSTEKAEMQKELMMKQKQLGDLQNRLNNALNSKGADRAAEASQKTIDTLKLQLKQLQEKLTSANAAAAKAAQQATQDAKKSANKGDDNEFKHKYDQANKMLKATKDENEKLKKKSDDLRLAETQLKVEIGKLQAQIKSLLKK